MRMKSGQWVWVVAIIALVLQTIHCRYIIWSSNQILDSVLFTVQPTDTLVIQSGVNLSLNNATFIVKGNIVVNGTMLNPVVLTLKQESTISLLSSSVGEFLSVIIEQQSRQNTIFLERAEGSFTNCTFNGGQGVTLKDSKVYISECSIVAPVRTLKGELNIERSNLLSRLDTSFATRANFHQNTIERDGFIGASAALQFSATENSFTGTKSGILVISPHGNHDFEATIEQNVFKNVQQPLILVSDGDCSVSNNVFERFIEAVKITSDHSHTVTVEHNLFRDGVSAITASSDVLHVHNNTVTKCSKALYHTGVENSVLTVLNNTFVDNSNDNELIRLGSQESIPSVSIDFSGNKLRSSHSTLSAAILLDANTKTKLAVSLRSNWFAENTVKRTVDLLFTVLHNTEFSADIYQNVFENPDAEFEVTAEFHLAQQPIHAVYNYWGTSEWKQVVSRVNASNPKVIALSPYFKTRDVNDWSAENIGTDREAAKLSVPYVLIAFVIVLAIVVLVTAALFVYRFIKNRHQADRYQTQLDDDTVSE